MRSWNSPKREEEFEGIVRDHLYLAAVPESPERDIREVRPKQSQIRKKLADEGISGLQPRALFSTTPARSKGLMGLQNK